MTFRTAALAAATASIALFTAASASIAHAQAAPGSSWRTSPLTLATLLQDGYKIVAVVNGPRGNVSSVDTIFVQRDQSAFKCLDPQQADANTKATCFELAQPASAADSK